ncbi:MAG: hypothetical protein EPN43_10875 [Jatrophihabitans sp.]|nr:MAG: hypothetical protein EPN43_10875 [Jatrophihabitans sp.]
MLDVAVHTLDGRTAVDLGRRGAPPLPVDPALAPLLPDGLPRGGTVAVTGSISLLLALVGAASADGAWCALVGFPHISAEAATEYGVVLERLAVVPDPGASWPTVLGALVDAVDVVAARPPRALAPGEVRRISARVRTRESALIAFGGWPGAQVCLAARAGPWTGIGTGTGRLRARQASVTARGRGAAARERTVHLWLPGPQGAGIAATTPGSEPRGGWPGDLAPVIPLADVPLAG